MTLTELLSDWDVQLPLPVQTLFPCRGWGLCMILLMYMYMYNVMCVCIIIQLVWYMHSNDKLGRCGSCLGLCYKLVGYAKQ